MRKGISEGKQATHYDEKTLQALEGKGYKYVQIKGLTVDKYHEYIEPHTMILVPMKELPVDPTQKDIYEPIASKILQQWVAESNDHFKVLIANVA